MKPAPAPTRFWKHVVKTDGCWEWTAATHSYGYGVFHAEHNRKLNAHCYAYELAHGPIPAGMVVRHTCDNPSCVNPAHLVLGTHAENVADRVARGRSAVGERNGRHKLTAAQVRSIFERAQAGISKAELARKYGVDQAVIRRIVTGNAWRHLNLTQTQ